MSAALRAAVFALASAAFIRLSWRSLKNPRTHGFYRFFAFELVTGLILLNLPVWFRDPLSLSQIVSYALGAASMVLALAGFQLLRVVGKPSTGGQHDANLAFEKTTTLVTVGIYRFIRHPMYASLLALVWCAQLKDPSAAAGLAIAVATTGFLLATAIAEERENLARFGASYAAYMKRTRRFVPFVF